MSKASELLACISKTTTETIECYDKNGKTLSPGHTVKTADGEGKVTKRFQRNKVEYVIVNDKEYLTKEVEKVES